MSHPAGISSRWQRTISRKRRRIRLRTTAPPRAFLMLKPKRLCGSSLARKKTVKWELERRFPARYTASNSPRRTSRASRGNRFPRTFKPGARSLFPALFGGEPMASLLAARRQHLAAALGLHANAEAVRLGAPAASRLKCALWQNNPPLLFAIGNTQSRCALFHPQNTHHHFQRLIPNLVVYSTLARRVKKCAKALTSIRSAAPAFRLFIRS